MVMSKPGLNAAIVRAVLFSQKWGVFRLLKQCRLHDLSVAFSLHIHACLSEILHQTDKKGGVKSWWMMIYLLNMCTMQTESCIYLVRLKDGKEEIQ